MPQTLQVAWLGLDRLLLLASPLVDEECKGNVLVEVALEWGGDHAAGARGSVQGEWWVGLMQTTSILIGRKESISFVFCEACFSS